jgi:cyclopropane fatty-acyl-phospholipid synthase-like methyltransferase
VLKDVLRSAVPMPARMRLAAWITRQPWLPARDYVAVGLIRDLQARDPKLFHKFAWANHLMAYAQWYDSEEALFAAERLEASRVELFRDLSTVLEELKLPPGEVGSILEAGCSQGYLLRHLETHLFPNARDIVGVDIDAPAIEKGQRFLAAAGSRVRLVAGDMEQLDTLLGPRRYDITMAAGVLSYLDEDDAARMVSRLLARTGRVLVLAGLACTVRNNNELARSELSPGHAGQWIHNFEALVARAGGRVVRSRWEGAKQYNFQTICFVFATPPHQTSQQ